MKIPLYRRDRWVHELKDLGNTPTLIIGDPHGCYEEMMELIELAEIDISKHVVICVGDLVDRGPFSDHVLQYFMTRDNALSVLGNHDHKLLRYLASSDPQNINISRGLSLTLDQIDPEDKMAVRYYLENLPLVIESHSFRVVHGAYIPNALVTEGPLKGHYVDANNNDFLSHCIYGQTTGQKDENGYPIRSKEWIGDYSDTRDVIHGHTVVQPCPEITKSQRAKVYDIDGGCVFGLELVGIRYPDKKIFRVPAKKVYWTSRTNKENQA
jgi:Calcineurin-like phosphoesterase